MSPAQSLNMKMKIWLFRAKLVVVEAVLNIIAQAKAFARVFFYIKVQIMK